jgi:hypothetical protein
VESEDWATLSPGLGVTMSVGLATRRREVQVPALLERADTCLYLAKRSGRNRVIADGDDRAGDGGRPTVDAPPTRSVDSPRNPAGELSPVRPSIDR